MSMREIRRVLRVRHDAGLFARPAAASVAIVPCSGGKYALCLATADLSGPLPEGLPSPATG